MRFGSIPGLLTALYCILPGLMSILLALRFGEFMQVKIIALAALGASACFWVAYLAAVFVMGYKIADAMARLGFDEAAVQDEFGYLCVAMALLFLGWSIATIAVIMLW